MTSEQITARCAECGNDIAHEIINTGETTELESLCREMIEEGLARADNIVAGECSGYAVDDFTLTRIQKYLKAEAQRVKEAL